MATVVSNEYDHIDIVAGQTTNRHYLKDSAARASIEDLTAQTDELQTKMQQATTSLAGKVDGWYIENNVLYLTADGVIVGDGGISGIGGGGGGGGSDSGAVMTMTNGMDWLATTIRSGAPCPITVNWSSTISDVPTGNGTLRVSVNGAIKASLNVTQGQVTVDIGEYLGNGSNTVRFSLSDAYGSTRTLIYTIESILLQLTSSFDVSAPYTSAFTFPYTPVGSVEKTMHFKLDDVEQPTVTTSVSNRQLTYQVPAQRHGAHTIECWFTAEINEETVPSNHVKFEYMYVVNGNRDPIIITQVDNTDVTQYSTIPIRYRVYDPDDLQATIIIYENSEEKATLTVGREEQLYSYRASTAGTNSIAFAAGTTTKIVNFTVTASDIDIEAETEGLQLYLTSQGRSNAEQNPGVWTYDDIEAQMTGFNFVSDGWLNDEDGATVLRIGGDARVTIPFKLFASDFRASGKTIEIEFATRNVMNYDSAVISCFSGDRGIAVSSQTALIASEQSSVSTQFKENEHIRISFVVQKRSAQRLIFCYINGIVSGTVQYPDNDDFVQITPVNISLGSSDATLDIYSIRVYNHDLNRFQIVNNWIADTQNGFEMINRYTHNDVFDQYGNIVIAKLPSNLPYMVISGNLPTYKGNKLTVSGEYVNPIDPLKSFTFTDAEIDVQGTSSQYYARKNYKIKFNGGFVINSQTASKYAMNDSAIPVKTFTFKADVASSEGANNVELARLYNEICPYKTPYQKANAKVRQGIDGFPIVVFHNNGTDTVFLGKYNFNNDKGTEDVFGFSSGDESWEIKNNTSNRVLWKSDDYSGTDWLNDFEARYPEDNTNASNLQALATWLKSTDQTQATGNALPSPVTYVDGSGEDMVETTYTHDTAAYRLAKFKHELADHVEMDSIIFYYLFTELFMMVDSRAKNAFPSLMGGDKWCILPYDFDTAIGINNEGTLTLTYKYEDIDHLPSGADIYNGQDSVLWVNLRQAFFNEIRSMYQSLRSNKKLSYEKVESMFEAHQDVWPEAIFNEDAQYKYIDPLIDDGDASYLTMLQGSKESQRQWWLYNRFRYIDSKYNAGDALTDYIQLRGYALADITVVPYADIYPAVKYGSYLVTERGARNVATTLINPLDNVNDTEIYIYSCSQLSSVGDLSGLKVGFADFSRAVNLQAMKIGDASSSYENGNLTELYLGNNKLLKTVDVRNCPSLTQAVDLSGCTGLENVYFDGTAVRGVQLPNGGVLKKLHLPGTITNLTILNQMALTEFVCPDYSNITTLRIENPSDAVDVLGIIDDMQPGGLVRLYNFHWEMENASALIAEFDKLDTMRGLDQDGNQTEHAQVYGTVHIPNATGAELAIIQGRYPGITVTYDNLTSYLYYYDFYGNTLLYTEEVVDGGNGHYDGTPSRPSNTAKYTFDNFRGWSFTKENNQRDPWATVKVEGDRNVYAAFSYTINTYQVRFYNGETLLQTSQVPYGTAAEYTGTTPIYNGEDTDAWGEFIGWDTDFTNITEAIDVFALYEFIGSVTRYYLTKELQTYSNDSLTSLGQYAFYYHNKLYSIDLPNIVQIGDYAFNQCTSLVNLNIPRLTTLGYRSFSQCDKLLEIDLPLVEKIPVDCFELCDLLNSVNIPAATFIGSSAFDGCRKLQTINMPAVTFIGSNAFDLCTSLETIDVPLVTEISYDAFSHCNNLKSVNMPNLITAGTEAFDSCTQLISINLPLLEATAQGMFTSCYRLPSIELPNVTSIATQTFHRCNSLTTIVLRYTGAVVTLENTNALSSSAITNIYVPDELVSAYKSATNWNTFASKIKGLSELSA